MAQIEHSPADAVQNPMRWIKTILAALLPLLWLATSNFDSTATADIGIVERVAASVPALDARQGGHGAANDVYSTGKWARHLGRRAGVCSGSERIMPAVMVSACPLPELRPVGIDFSRTEAPAGLVHCWQFYWRTAMEARAPSTVS